jgi:hypothetical protein
VKSEKKGNDYMVVSNHGIQFSIGPTYSFHTKPIAGELSTLIGTRGDYTITPKSQLGIYAEFGMVHFPKWKGTPIKSLKKSRIMDYIDWGLGFRNYAGGETTTVNIKNALGEIISTQTGKGDFRNGYLYGQVSAHTLIYYGKKRIDKARKHFIDQSLGFNFDYNILRGDTVYQNNFAQDKSELKFQKPFMLQMHYSLGVGIRLTRAWMMIPSAQLPILGLYQWNGFNGRINWFSSQYWPVQAQIKFIKLFEHNHYKNILFS